MSFRWRWSLLLVLILAIETTYVLIVSAGTFVRWPTYLSYFDHLAEGFRAGHLHLSIKPPPELVAKADPFDPAHQHLWAIDATYYKGEYYLYWGPTPALVLAAFKTIFRISAFVGDVYLIFFFYSLQLVFGALLLERIWRRVFPAVPVWALAVALLVFAFATPTAHSLASGAVYNTAIAAGQAFLLGGVLFAFDALAASERGGRLPPWRLLLPGLFFALALSCRLSLPPTVLLLCLVTALATNPPGRRRWRGVMRDLAWLGVLPILAVLALLLYNKLRFESWTDFGNTRQLSTLRHHVSLAYLAPNLYSYLLRPVVVACQFPFVVAPWFIDARGFPSGMVLPPRYWAAEPLVGVAVAYPFAWLGLASIGGICWALRARWLAARRGETPEARTPKERLLLWCVLAALILCTNSAYPLLVLFMPSMRHLGDISVGMVLTGTLGAWWLLERFRASRRRRRLVAALVLALAVPTIAVGLLLGYEGYNQHFKIQNPELDRRLTESLSFCSD